VLGGKLCELLTFGAAITNTINEDGIFGLNKFNELLFHKPLSQACFGLAKLRFVEELKA